MKKMLFVLLVAILAIGCEKEKITVKQLEANPWQCVREVSQTLPNGTQFSVTNIYSLSFKNGQACELWHGFYNSVGDSYSEIFNGKYTLSADGATIILLMDDKSTINGKCYSDRLVITLKEDNVLTFIKLK